MPEGFMLCVFVFEESFYAICYIKAFKKLL